MPVFDSLVLKFYEDISSSGLDTEIDALLSAGAKRIFIASSSVDASSMKKSWEHNNLAIDIASEDSLEGFAAKIIQYDAVILHEYTDIDRLSSMMLSCLHMKTGIVVAPVTSDYYMNRPIYIMTIPKAGTHMLIGMLERLGIKRNYLSVPQPGKWSTVNSYNYHAPCKDFFEMDWSSPVGRNPLFRSPAIFMYRNPLDVIVSELSWYQKEDSGFSHFMRTLKDDDERLMRLISDKVVFGTIRERTLRYAGWLDFANVIPVSYEELVGSSGGGDDAEQVKTIWSFQLKLHIPGNPIRIAEDLYDEKSPTFEKGKVGRHRNLFTKKHFDAVATLNQDFMEMLGYSSNCFNLPLFVDKFRNRPLKIKRSTQEELWTQRLVKESYMGYNIVVAGGQHIVISQECGPVDLTKEQDRQRQGVYLGFDNTADAMRFIEYELLRKNSEANIAAVNTRIDNIAMKIKESLLFKAYSFISKLGR